MLVSTTSFRPVLRAVWARTWMVRLTPLTSAKVSVIQALWSLARRRWAAAGKWAAIALWNRSSLCCVLKAAR